MSSRAAQPLVVVQAVRRWLRQTETWIYRQLMDLPTSIESHVVCDDLENLDQFPFPRLHARQQQPKWLRAVDRAAARVRLDAGRQLGLVALANNATVLHSHFGNIGFKNLAAARAVGLAHVVTFYGYDVSQLPRAPVWQARYAQLFQQVDRVLCEGPHMRQQLLALGCPAHVAHVQHLGVDLPNIPFEPRSWSAGQPLRVLIAGSFREKKGIPYALLALGELRRRRPALQLEVTIIGGAGASPAQKAEERKIHEAAAASELGERLRFLGYQPFARLLEESRRAQIFLSPSVLSADGDSEGGAPVSIIEMAASGMPIVSTQHCDIPNVLTGSAARFLGPERDVPALVRCLEQLLDAPEQWPALTSEVRRDLETRFDARRQALRLAQHYQELAQAPRKLGSSQARGVALARAAVKKLRSGLRG